MRSSSLSILAVGAAQLLAGETFAETYVRVGPTSVGGIATTHERYVYASNSQPGTLSAYRRDEQSGLLTPIGEAIPLGRQAGNVVSDSKGRRLYVASGPVETYDERRLGPIPLHVLTTDASSGAAVLSQALTLKESPILLAVDPLDRFVFAIMSSGAGRSIQTLSIAPDTGQLTAVGKPPLTTGERILVDPLGRFLYGPTAGHIVAHKIDPASGALTESGYADIPGAIAGLHPNGKFALITVERALGVFAVNAENGLFTPTTHAVDLGSMEISHLVFTADGRRAHAATGSAVLELTFNPDNGDIAIAGGTLVSADTNTPGNHIARLAVAGEGRFVYAVGKPGTIFGFRFDAKTGELSHLGVPEVPCFVPFAAASVQSGASEFVRTLIENRGVPVLDMALPPPEFLAQDVPKWRYESDTTHPVMLLPRDQLADYIGVSGATSGTNYTVLALGRKDGRVYKFGGSSQGLDVLAASLDEIPTESLMMLRNPSEKIRARVLHARPHGERATLTDAPGGKKALRYTLYDRGVAGGELMYTVTQMPAVNVPQVAPTGLGVNLWIWDGDGGQGAAIFDLQPGGIATWAFVLPDVARYLSQPHPR